MRKEKSCAISSLGQDFATKLETIKDNYKYSASKLKSMICELKTNSEQKLMKTGKLIESIISLEDLLKAEKEITLNPVRPKDLGVDERIVELDIVTKTLAELNKNIAEKLDTKQKEFGRQEFNRLQQFPNEEERKEMQSKHFEKTKDAFVKEKSSKFEELDKGVINNFFEVRKNYPCIKEGIQEYIKIKVHKFKQFIIKLDEIRTGIVENYDKKVLSQLWPGDIENMKNFSKNFIVNSKKKVLDKLYKRRQEFLSADNSIYLELFNDDWSIYKTFIEQYFSQLIAEVQKEIHAKILLKVDQINNNFNCKALLSKVGDETLNFVKTEISREHLLPSQIKSNAENMANCSFNLIEYFISINVPDLESVKNEELINRSKIGFRELKDKFEKDLKESIDKEINQPEDDLNQEQANMIADQPKSFWTNGIIF